MTATEYNARRSDEGDRELQLWQEASWGIDTEQRQPEDEDDPDLSPTRADLDRISDLDAFPPRISRA